MNPRNTAASVRARLLTRARETRQDFNLVLTRYALERLLYRLSVSPHADQFLLKGALLFDVWFDIPHRPTRDADFLGFGPAGLPHLEAVFKTVCALETDDGVTFRPDSVQAAEIRKEANYGGVRVTLLGLIDGARCPIQIDIGFGDAVTPGPEDVQYLGTLEIAPLVVVEPGSTQQVQHTHHPVHRGTDFVAHGGEKFALGLGGDNGLVAGLRQFPRTCINQFFQTVAVGIQLAGEALSLGDVFKDKG